MTLDAKLHFQVNRRPGEGKSHLHHVPVAFLARNFACHDMPAMGKIGVVRDSMHLYPRNLFLLAYVADQLFFFLAVRHGFFMATLAKIDIGDGSLLMGRDPRMAVKTG
jgi:hypothetical protein